MSVELIEQSSPELVAAMERLIPQLSRSAKPLTAEQTQALVDQDSVYLFVSARTSLSSLPTATRLRPAPS